MSNSTLTVQSAQWLKRHLASPFTMEESLPRDLQLHLSEWQTQRLVSVYKKKSSEMP